MLQEEGTASATTTHICRDLARTIVYDPAGGRVRSLFGRAQVCVVRHAVVVIIRIFAVQQSILIRIQSLAPIDCAASIRGTQWTWSRGPDSYAPVSRMLILAVHAAIVV